MPTTVKTATFEPRPWRFDRHAFDTMHALGLFGTGRGVELLDGRVYERGQPKVWTREDYYRLGKAGLFGHQRVELVNGEIIEMSPVNEPHSISLTLAHELLAARLPSGWYIRNQMPLAIAGRRPNDPLPDVAVIEGRPRDFPVEPPAWARLVVEISDSSLDFDLTDKARLYATAGIPAYWVVDLSNRAVQVFRLPTADGYSQQTVMTALQALTLPWPADPVQVGDLLP